MASTLARRAVLTRIAGRALALPIEHVVETMRPLPIEPIEPGEPGEPGAPGAADGAAGAPGCVLGTAQIRGERIAVIDAARLFALVASAPPRRFVIVRAGQARVALQVDAVVDVRALGDGEPVGAAPGLAELAELATALRDARWIEEP